MPRRFVSIPRPGLAVLALSLAACADPGASDRDAGPVDAGAVEVPPDALVDDRLVDPCLPSGLLPSVCPGRGLYDGPVAVELRATVDAGAVIYTLDGSEPGAGNGIPYDGRRIAIAAADDRGLVVLRARAGDGPVVTHSYVFPANVLAQPIVPAGVPTMWSVAPDQPGDYAMDARVMTVPTDAELGLAALPTVSLVLAPDDLFGTTQGIYLNPENDGPDWERAASVEVFGAGVDDVQAGCGVRIQGGTSVLDWKSPKLSMRLAFRSVYGADELDGQLFGADATDSFDNLILDAHLNFTWVHPDVAQRNRADYLRDRFTADLQNRIGSLAPHGRFVHLFLNGLYWGVYELHERPDEHFAASYLGGDDSEYDVLKHTGSTIVAGDDVAWRAMVDLARAGLADPARYAAIQELLEVDDLIDYMLVNFWTGNDDWPHHNWYAARRRTADGRFRFFSWDAEHVLKNVSVDRTTVNVADSPAELYQALLANPDFAARLAARADALFAPAGGFDGAALAAHYAALAAAIRPAMVLESARWGDSQTTGTPHEVAAWETEIAGLLTDYFPARSAVVAAQLSAP